MLDFLVKLRQIGSLHAFKGGTMAKKNHPTAKGYIKINAEYCKECLFCINVCTRGHLATSHSFNSRGYRPVAVNPEGGECSACGLCALVCPDIAIEVYRE